MTFYIIDILIFTLLRLETMIIIKFPVSPQKNLTKSGFFILFEFMS